MFHWICPECGREIPPAVKECPVCDPQISDVSALDLTSVSVLQASGKALSQPTPAPVMASVSAAVAERVSEPVSKPTLVPIGLDLVPAPVLRATPPVIEPVPVLAAVAEPISKHQEPELVLDPVLRLALRVGETPPVSEPAPVLVSEPVSTHEEPELIADPLLRLALKVAATPPMAEPAPVLAPVSEPVSKHEEPELIPDPLLRLALKVDQTASVSEAAPVLVSEPVSTHEEPELVPDPLLRLALKAAATPPITEPQPILAGVPEPISKHEEPELIPDPVLRLALTVGLTQPETEPEPVLAEVPALRSDDSIAPVALRVRPPQAPTITSPPELPGLGELAAALDSEATPVPSLEPQWQARQLEAASTVALLAAPAEPVPALEPVAAALVPSAEFTALRSTALASPAPIPLPVPVPGVAGKPEPENAFARPAPALPLAALQDYTATARYKIRPASPRPPVLGKDAAPRITLPGPALPPQLLSLRHAGIATVATPRARRAKKPTPGWLVTAVVTVVLFGIGATAVFTLMPHTASGDPTPAPSVPAAPKQVEASTTAPATAFSLAKAVEVTGFRFSTDASKKPEVHYIVVNHSSSGLDDVMVYVTLRASGAKPGQPPLSKFSFHTPSLGPLESKEMTTPLEKLPRPGPEWQDLRAEVELGR